MTLSWASSTAWQRIGDPRTLATSGPFSKWAVNSCGSCRLSGSPAIRRNWDDSAQFHRMLSTAQLHQSGSLACPDILGQYRPDVCGVKSTHQLRWRMDIANTSNMWIGPQIATRYCVNASANKILCQERTAISQTARRKIAAHNRGCTIVHTTNFDRRFVILRDNLYQW